MVCAGITVFDVTEPANPRYCFVDFMGMESEREVDLDTPLSARTYLEAYYELHDPANDEVGLLPLVESFQNRSLITKEALADTWPDGAWEHQSPSNVDSTDPLDLGGLDIADKPKSLRNQAMDQFLDVLLDPSEQDVHTLMAETDHLNDFVPSLRRRLYDQASILEPSAKNIGLLHKALEGVTTVDLSLFKLWSAEHLSAVVSHLQAGVDGLKVLNMSNMPDLTEAELAAIMKLEDGKATPHLNTIIILETPKISLDFVAKHFGKYDVYHSELFRRALYLPHLSRYGAAPPPALQFDAPDNISQLVWVGISTAQSWDKKFRLEDGHFDWNTLKYSTHMGSGYGRDPNLSYMTFMLDIPLPIAKATQGLRRLLQYMPLVQTYPFDNVFAGGARCFATTSTLDDDGYSIGPLSQTLSEERQYLRDDPAGSGRNQYLKPGHWAILLIHEAFNARDQEQLDRYTTLDENEDKTPAYKPVKRLRYMLAQATPDSSTSGSRFLTVDVPTYIDSVLKDDADQIRTIKTWWAKEMANVKTGVSFYDEQDAQAILDRVYSKEGFGEVGTGGNSD